MNTIINKILLLTMLLSVFCCAEVFADKKTLVFFAESFDSVSKKVIEEMGYSDKFCINVSFDTSKFIGKNIKNLIMLRKIEPAVKITEPYFPLISNEIKISSGTVLDRTQDFKNFLQNYKDNFRKTFSIKKHGMFLKGIALNDNVLKEFHNYNILWTTAKGENEYKKGVFFRNGVALFVPYVNFPSSIIKIKVWLSSVNNRYGFIPILLTNEQLKNENFMLKLIEFIETSENIDTALPVDAAYYLYQTELSEEFFSLPFSQQIPLENKIKLYLAGKEADQCDKEAENYPIIYDELSNMFSYDIINGIINEDKNSSMLFDISYANVFRLLNKKAPDLKDFEDFFEVKEKNEAEKTSDGQKCGFYKNSAGITINNYGKIFSRFTVRKNDNSVGFAVDMNFTKADYYDIYIDMNSIPYAGEQEAVSPLKLFFVPDNGWEYALRVTKDKVDVYKFMSNSVELIKTFDTSGGLRFSVPASVLRGNPYNWAYQIIAVKNDEVTDFIETESSKEKLFKKTPLHIKMFKL